MITGARNPKLISDGVKTRHLTPNGYAIKYMKNWGMIFTPLTIVSELREF
jgi:hypothetical protein